MRLHVLTAGLTLAMTAACAETENDTGTAEDEAAIRALNTAYATQWSTRDSAGFWGSLANDYQEVMPDGSHHADKAAVQAMTRVDWAARPDGATLAISTTYVKFLDDDVAVSGGTWTMSGMPAGAPARGAWTATYRKDAEAWKVVTTLAANEMAMPAPPSADTAAAMP